MNKLAYISRKLDIEEHITKFCSYFARDKSFVLQGDYHRHHEFIQALEHYELKPIVQTSNCDEALRMLSKEAVLKFQTTFEFFKILRYFAYLKQFHFKHDIIIRWLDNIHLPSFFYEFNDYFTYDGCLNELVLQDLKNVNEAIKDTHAKIQEKLSNQLKSRHLKDFLVHYQIHFYQGQNTLLLRGGFDKVLKGRVLGRSQQGFFYVHPNNINDLKDKIQSLENEKEHLIYIIEKRLSSALQSNVKFLKFINQSFDILDHYLARIAFAKASNLEIIYHQKNDKIILSDFKHPILNNPKPISVNFDKSLLLITGVNAGGKSMLLKSILAATFMTKYLIPFACNKAKTVIAYCKNIIPIIEDNQNASLNISTFSGRILEFKKLFSQDNAVVGIDEIEIGTDSDEAAALFKVLLEQLLKRNLKIVITTHHKRLAVLLAHHSKVQLLAALYDEEHQLCKYEFLAGIIGKSYAFETASKYGISKNIIEEAKKVYGEDKMKLNTLIEKGTQLELELKSKQKEYDILLEELTKEKNNIENLKIQTKAKLQEERLVLHNSFYAAISQAKKAAKANSVAEIHSRLNKAHQRYQEIQVPNIELRYKNFKIGDKVKHFGIQGELIAMKNGEASIEYEGKLLKVPLKNVEKSCDISDKKQDFKVLAPRHFQATLSLDLHGFIVEDALEALDKFLSDAILNGSESVLVCHGIGSGILSRAVRGFLKQHPIVQSYEDAPARQGGIGATIVKF